MEYDFYNFAKKIFDQELDCIFRLHFYVILTVTRPFCLIFLQHNIKEYANTFQDGEVKSKGYFYEKVYGPSGKITK